MTTTIRETIGPDGQRTRVVTNEMTTVRISRTSTPNLHNLPIDPPQPDIRTGAAPNMPAFPPFPAVPAMPAVPTIPSVTAMPVAPAVATAPAMPAIPIGLRRPQPQMMHFGPQTRMPAMPGPDTTTAWLLSSPQGPQALVFAPAHGLFTTAQSPAVFDQTSVPRSTQTIQTTNPRPQRDTAPGAPVVPAARLAVPRRQEPNNDPVAFVFERGWLFLRMYMLLFLVASPGTARHNLLLGAIVAICLLPRSAIFWEIPRRLRQEVDRLAQHNAPPRRQQANNRARGPNQMPTPEETAARLVAEQEEQPNAVRDIRRWVERTLALLLASLVPGVGEAQVRAREEAQREAERIERERRAEEERRISEQTEKDKKNEGSDDARNQDNVAAEVPSVSPREHAVATSSAHGISESSSVSPPSPTVQM